MADYSSLYQAAGSTFNVDPLLAQAVAQVESGENPGLTSPQGAVGVMQVMPGNLQRLNVPDPYNPEYNIPAGTRMLDEALTTANGNVPLALRIYQGGPDQSKWGPQNAAYPGKVAAAYQKLATTQRSAAARPNDAVDDLIAGKPSPAANDALDDFIMGKSAPAQTAPAQPAATSDPLDDVITGGNAPAWAQPKPTPAPTPAPVMLDDYGRPVGSVTVPAPVQNTVNAAVQGAKEGFGTAPFGMSTQTDQALVDAGVFNGPNEYNPLKGINRGLIGSGAALGDLALRSGSALLGAYQRGVSQAGAEVGAPLLGRDLAALPEAFPTGEGHGTIGGRQLPPTSPVVAPSNPLVREISPAAHDALDAPLSASFRDNPGVTAPSAVGEVSANPLVSGSRPIAAPQVAPAPASVGAAASSATEANMTPAQIQAYRSTAEGQKLLEPQPIGVQDHNAYVPGVTPSEAEIEQTVNAARELKSLNVTAPEVSQEAKETAAQNSAQRQQFFSDAAGSPVTVQNLRDDRSAQFTKDSEATLASGTGDADTTPITNAVNDILNTPTGKQNTELQTYVRPLLNRLQDADGVAKITDPAELIGFRQDVNRMLSKTSQAATPNLAHISDELRSIVGTTDDAIEAARPGYAQQRANYANYSRQIDEQNALQGFEPKLYGANNQMQYSRVQNMMRQIVDARSSPGVNEAKSITDDTMQKLWNLRDDLRRVASAQDLARAPGSDSVQNAFDALVGHGKKAADVLVHGAIATHLPGVGNLAYTAVKHAVTAGAETKAAARQTARGMEMLHPKTPLRNPLSSP